MLQAIRERVAKWVVSLIIGLLILGFASWELAGTFGLRGQDPLTTPAIIVESEVITLATFGDELDVERNNPTGPNMPVREALQLGIYEDTIDRLVDNRVLAAESRELGVVPPRSMIELALRDSQQFRDPQTGGFSLNRLAQVAAENGYSPQGYIELLRRETGTSIFGGALLGAVSQPPDVLRDRLTAYLGETRSVEALTLPLSELPPLEDPDDEALATYYDTVSSQFLTDQRRQVTVLMLRAGDVAEELEIGERDIERRYQRDIEDYSDPERRELRQILAPDAATAADIQAFLRETPDLEAAAESFDLDVITPDPVAEGDLMADAAFATDVGGITDPVETPFGFIIAEVTGELPAEIRSLDDVRDRIVEQLQSEEARDLLDDGLLDEIDEGVQLGETLESLAEAYDARLIALPAMTVDGDTDQLVMDSAIGLTLMREIAERSFTDLDEEGEMTPLVTLANGGAYWLRLDSLEPAEPRPLDDVRDQVLTLWRSAQNRTRLRDEADAVLAAIQSGEQSWAETVTETRPMIRVDGIRRDGGNDADLPLGAMRGLFSQQLGDFTASSTAEAALITRLVAIEPGQPTDGDIVARASQQIVELDQVLLRDSLIADLRDRLDITINRTAIEEYLDDYATSLGELPL